MSRCCRFGNFLCNNVNERRKLSVPTLTVSLWAHLRADEESFRNPSYKKYTEVGRLALIFESTDKRIILILRWNTKPCDLIVFLFTELNLLFPFRPLPPPPRLVTPVLFHVGGYRRLIYGKRIKCVLQLPSCCLTLYIILSSQSQGKRCEANRYFALCAVGEKLAPYLL